MWLRLGCTCFVIDIEVFHLSSENTTAAVWFLASGKLSQYLLLRVRKRCDLRQPAASYSDAKFARRCIWKLIGGSDRLGFSFEQGVFYEHRLREIF
jgi:hypothetical protein